MMASSPSCDMNVTCRLSVGRAEASGVAILNTKRWSGARDSNPGPHGPEPRYGRVGRTISTVNRCSRTEFRAVSRAKGTSRTPTRVGERDPNVTGTPHLEDDVKWCDREVAG